MDTLVSACKLYSNLDSESMRLLDDLLSGEPVDINGDYSRIVSFLDYLAIFPHDLSIRSRQRVSGISRKIELALEEEFDEEE